ncbi:MAG: hypothetical protein M3256_09350 [Actinomycetota bacterium]|nr:hypothetical protein [Actinomycetota bacterium]
MVIDISGFDAKAQLTLPAMAAQVQMGVASAQYKLMARGYVGPLSEVLIDPGELNVESYVKLTGAISKLQRLLADDVQNIRPVPLFVDLPAGGDSEGDRRWAVGATFALSQIADGQSLAKSRRVMDWDSWSEEAKQAIEETYTLLVGAKDDDFQPDGAMKASAQSYLGPLRIKR